MSDMITTGVSVNKRIANRIEDIFIENQLPKIEGVVTLLFLAINASRSLPIPQELADKELRSILEQMQMHNENSNTTGH